MLGLCFLKAFFSEMRLSDAFSFANVIIEGKVAKPLTSFAEYALRRILPQAQSLANQNKRRLPRRTIF